MERAEYLARILEVTQRLTTLPLAYVGIVQRMGMGGRDRGLRPRLCRCLSGSERRGGRRLALLLHRQSLLHPAKYLEIARTNARAVRTALTVKVWDAIDGTWLELKRFGNGPTSREEFMRFLRWVQECLVCASTLGLPHHAAQRHLLVLPPRRLYGTRRRPGAHPRREVSHAVAGAQNGSADRSTISSGRRSCARFRRSPAYHWVYRESVKPWLIADLLILRDEMPGGSLRQLLREPRGLPSTISPAPMAARGRPSVSGAHPARSAQKNSRMEEIFRRGVREFIGDFIESNNRLGAAITEQYLM